MNSRMLTVGILAVLVGLTGGFLLANGLNRSTINALKTQLDQRGPAANTNPGTAGDLAVDAKEIKTKIAEADANPTDLAFQKSLGRGLYRFGTMKKDADLVREAKRLLERANSLDPKDHDVLVDLGNAYFDIGYFNKDSASFKLARDTYQRALTAKPNDADVQTDYALTFYVDEPADLKMAIAEFEKALKINPKQERALQFLTSTHVRESDFASAEKTLALLESANPKNEAIAGLRSQISNKTYTPLQ